MAADQTEFDPESLTLDANAVAGMLQAIFGSDMTAAWSECAHCGNQAMVGTMRAYLGAAVVLRCSICTRSWRASRPCPMAAIASTCAAPLMFECTHEPAAPSAGQDN